MTKSREELLNKKIANLDLDLVFPVADSSFMPPDRPSLPLGEVIKLFEMHLARYNADPESFERSTRRKNSEAFRL
jgi:hypothetical protein